MDTMPNMSDFVWTEPFAPNTQPITEIPGDSGLSTNVRQLGDGRSEASGVSAGALLGYARVSRDDQNLGSEEDRYGNSRLGAPARIRAWMAESLGSRRWCRQRA